MNNKQICSKNKEGFLQKLHLLQIRGCLKRHRFSPNVKLFHKLPSRLVFPLKELVGDAILLAGHVFLGFTRDGHFLLSYTLQVEADVNTAMPCYTYQLHWWHFMPYRPLKKMSEVRLFGENEISQDLRIVVCQWPMDEENILIYGCCSSSIQDAVQCYLTITAQPPLQQCSDCLITKEKQLLNELVDGEGSHTSRCLKHSFIVHTNFMLVPPYPSFSPSICMKKDKMVIINTGDNILSLSVETQTVLSSSIKPDTVQMKSNFHISNGNNKEVSITNRTENSLGHNLQNGGFPVEDNTTVSRLDSLNNSHIIYKSRENSCHIGSPLQCHLIENCIESSSYNYQMNRDHDKEHTLKKPECTFSAKFLKEDGITLAHHNNFKHVQLEIPCERYIDNASVPQIEENCLLNQNRRHRNAAECNSQCITHHNYESVEDMSSKLTYSSSCGNLQSLPIALSPSDRNKRSSIEELDNGGTNDERRKPSDIKQQKDTSASYSALYCDESDLLNQNEHQCNDKLEFCKTTTSFPLASIDEAIKENISPDPKKKCACCGIHSFSSDHCIEVSTRNRSEVTFCCSSHCCTFMNSKLNQILYTRDCVSEAIHYFVQEDNSNYVREESDDFCNSEYPTIFSLEVHGTAYKPLKMLKKSSLHCWQGQAVIIHQVVFDIELYIHEMGQRICTAAGVKYLAFSDYDVQIIDLCPVSSIVVILVLMLVQATVEKKDGDDALNLGRHMYQTGFKFEWNIATGVYSVTDTDELKEIDTHHRTHKRWNEIWNPAQQAVKRLQKSWLLPSSTIHSVNILTNEAVFQGKSLKVLWPASHHVAVVL